MTETAADRAMRGEELLAQGDYAAGFRLYDAWRELHPDQWLNLPIPRWRGDQPEGRILITGEQGFGDQIMYARFAQLLRWRGVDLIWLCEPPLERLFNLCLGIPALSRESGGDAGEITCYCPSSALPNAFFPPLTAPPDAPYLTPPVAQPCGKKIGIVTRGSPKHDHDAARSLPPHLATQLLDIPDTLDLGPECTGAKDFYDTAQLVAGLELVITVDTAVAHLSAAMGKPTWILLSSDWTDPRWQRGRTDSPWYQSARLFRQPTPGDWAAVLHEVREALRAL